MTRVKITRRPVAPLLAAAVIGLAITLILFFTLRTLENQNAHAAFERAAQERFDGLEANIALNLNDIVALGAFFDVSQTVQRRDFSRLAIPLLDESKALQALEWAPRVPKNLRQSYENAAHHDGLPSFQFTERASDGRMVTEPEHREYAPVIFVEPLKGNEKALGFDLLSSAARREAVWHSTDKGALGATGRIVLVQETSNQYGVLIFRPVYRNGDHPEGEGKRRASLAGLLLGVLRVGNIVEQTAPAAGVAGRIGLVILDLDAPLGERLLYPNNISYDPAGKRPGIFHSERTVSVAGRSWQIVANSQPGAFAAARWTSWAALAAGLLITALWTSYVHLSLTRRSVIQQTVQERTSTLHSALAKLRESEERYRKLLDLSPDAVIVGRNEAITLANRAAIELIGVSNETDLIGRRVTDFVCTEHRAATEAIIQQMYSREMQLPLREEQLCREDGSLLDVELAASSFSDSGGRVIQAVFRDITRRKHAEAERARLIRCIEQTGESVVITDLKASIVYVNPAFEELTGYTSAEAIGKNPSILKSNEHPDSFYQEMWSTLLRGENWSGELINKRKDGTLFQEEATISPIKGKSGRVINYAAVKRDITMRKQTEAALAQAKERAETANRAKSEFLASMSHEIRTPMNGVIGMLELVLDTPLDPSQRECVQLAKNSGDSLLAVINDILDFSKVEAGKLELEQIDFNLHDLVRETLKTLSLRADQKGLELAYTIDDATPQQVIGDPGRLRQVLVNLVGNAIKFTQKGEIVVNVTHRHEEDQLAEILFTIVDTGIGIPADKQSLIFEAFTQADNSTTRTFGGTGLGLPISARLVALMGGRVWVDSAVGMGSTFRFTAKLKTSVTTVSSTKNPETELAGISVLVVDDNQTNRRILEMAVTSWGMCCRTASSAKEGLALLREAHFAGLPYRVVLTDCQMPEMDGFDFVEQVRNDANLSGALILMLTSADQRGGIGRCQSLGISRYLVKPIGKAELLRTIKAAIEETKDKAPSQPPPHSSPSSAAVESRDSLHVLIAEDNPVNQIFLRMALTRMGHTTVTVSNGHEAVDRVSRESFDLIFMDVQMPEMDGLQATAAIRELEALHGSAPVPICALTAHALQGDRERCLAAGMDDYVSKPVKLSEIARVTGDVSTRIERAAHLLIDNAPVVA